MTLKSVDQAARPSERDTQGASGAGRTLALLGFAVLLVGGGGVAVFVFGGGGDQQQSTPVQLFESSEQVAANIQEALDTTRALLGNGENEKAMLILDEAIERYPRGDGLLVLRASIHAGGGDFVAGYEDMEAALAVSEPHPELSFTTGFYAQRAGLLDEALKNMLRAQELGPDSPKYPLYLAALRLERSEPGDAKADLLRVVQLDDGIVQAWGMLAQIALDENRLSVATGHIKRARELAPNTAAYRLLEARILKRDLKPETAAIVLLGIPESERLADVHIVNELGATYMLLGETEKAAELFAAASPIHPADADLAYQAARLLNEVGDTRRALRFADRAKFLGSEAGAALADRLADGRLGG